MKKLFKKEKREREAVVVKSSCGDIEYDPIINEVNPYPFPIFVSDVYYRLSFEGDNGRKSLLLRSRNEVLPEIPDGTIVQLEENVTKFLGWKMDTSYRMVLPGVKTLVLERY